ncbi:hypothetical protein Sj15T_05620 [Sphingobium sp. TA15]|nr:hypothetical protein Sj15T_05620 [Sphingobium sp. TA15]
MKARRKVSISRKPHRAAVNFGCRPCSSNFLAASILALSTHADGVVPISARNIEQSDEGLGPVDIQPMAACKWQFSVLPVLTYFKYAALRVTKNYHFRLALN